MSNDFHGRADGPSQADWQRAKARFDKTRLIYQEMEGMPEVNTTLALRAVFDPLDRRFNFGERTQELYDEMMAVE